ncbi:sulfurtransferase FdhD [Sulfodiicoccus acidiphilus]|uniref:Sulfur carrier protein FdhD n=1 Tax=Sulfodiicoccus acidiphilus TaxID=1670455 RepID=A0A348B6M7_9CREN|nr:formate dehydrogenase accessory sulfurtransferase FdhD [Sulfodiicoccus acidiphilus]BBD73829.1 sulfurtransferase FdhD [Sulfodiicoccus acidiphilus]GGT96444.1 sulfurtransferase FdhD [Sulfodiicoccus acidiphilus]
MQRSTRRVRVLKLEDTDRWDDEEVVSEEPLKIVVNGKTTYMLSTPGEDEELVVGFLFTSGTISSMEDVHKIEKGRGEVRVEVRGTPPPRDFVNSACGMCGSPGILGSMVVEDEFKVEAKVLLSLPNKMKERQELFRSTGGLHAAALFDKKGKLLWISEDVGRHNAVDKLIGHFLILGEIPKGILQVSGRAGYEIIQKAGVAGFPVVSAISAPSSMAVEVAELLNIALVGFSRGSRLNVYTHPERIVY